MDDFARQPERGYSGTGSYATETGYVDEIVAAVKAVGFTVHRERRFPKGHMDIFAFQGRRNRHLNVHVIEAKLRSDLRSVTQAIGQLMYYGAAWGRGRVGLWFACPVEIDPYSLSVLEQLGIGLFRHPRQLEPWSPREVDAAYRLLRAHTQDILDGSLSRSLSFHVRTPSSIKREELEPWLEDSEGV